MAQEGDLKPSKRTAAPRRLGKRLKAWQPLAAGIIGAIAVIVAAIITTHSGTHPTSASPARSPGTSTSSQPATGVPYGVFTLPANGATNIQVKELLTVRGRAANIPPADHLEVFLEFDGSRRYYAAGNPDTAISLSADGHWSGFISIGEAAPITLWLAVLTPAQAQTMNEQVSYQSAGYPYLPGKPLAQVGFTAT